MTRVIGVAGPKGSSGCSFVTAGLGLCLAAAGIPTLVLDADAEEAGLAAIIGCRSPGESPAPVELNRHLQLLEAVSGPSREVDGREIVVSARSAFGAAVVDLGHQPGPLQKQIALAADWLLWVVTADPVGLGRADRLLSAPRLVAGSCGLVFNRESRASVRGAQAALAERHRLPLMATLRNRPGLAARGLLNWPPHRDRVLGRPFRELARTLHPLSTATPPAWP